MNLNDIIAALENYSLEREETRSSAENLKAAVLYFFEQIQSRANWTPQELEDLRERCQISRSLEMLDAALFDQPHEEQIEEV
ncbi:hypothetical protein GCM10028818_59780 [Spirosoma horti]